MADVICLGELLIDFVPTVTPTSLVDAPAFKKAPGGAPANVAVGLARLGTTSAFMGKVGDDPFGHFLADTLAAAGVDVSTLCFTAQARTALAFVSLRADGDREFMFYRHPSADMLFTPEEVDAAALGTARALHYGSISMISEPSRSATLHAIEVAKQSGCLISCDPNLRLPLWPDAASARDGMLQALAKAQVVKISDSELKFLTGSDDPSAARAVVAREHRADRDHRWPRRLSLSYGRKRRPRRGLQRRCGRYHGCRRRLRRRHSARSGARPGHGAG